MAAWLQMRQEQAPALTTEQQPDLVRQDLSALERRIAFIGATIAAIREDERMSEEDGP